MAQGRNGFPGTGRALIQIESGLKERMRICPVSAPLLQVVGEAGATLDGKLGVLRPVIDRGK